MSAARPLHSAKADISGSPSDVAEGPKGDIGQQAATLVIEAVYLLQIE